MANPHILSSVNQGTILFQIVTLYFQPNAIKLHQMTETLQIDFFFLGKRNIFFPHCYPIIATKNGVTVGVRGTAIVCDCVGLIYSSLSGGSVSLQCIIILWDKPINSVHNLYRRQGDTKKIRLFSRLLWFASSVKCLYQKKSLTGSVSLLPFAVGYFIYFVSVYFLVNLRHFSDVASSSDLAQAERRWQTVSHKNITKSAGSLRFPMKPRASSSDLKRFQSVLVLNN